MSDDYTPTTEAMIAAYVDVDTSPEMVRARRLAALRWLAEVERAAAEKAWDEGFSAGWAECADPGPFVNDVWDAKTRNPYRKGQSDE